MVEVVLLEVLEVEVVLLEVLEVDSVVDETSVVVEDIVDDVDPVVVEVEVEVDEEELEGGTVVPTFLSVHLYFLNPQRFGLHFLDSRIHCNLAFRNEVHSEGHGDVGGRIVLEVVSLVLGGSVVAVSFGTQAALLPPVPQAIGLQLRLNAKHCKTANALIRHTAGQLNSTTVVEGLVVEDDEGAQRHPRFLLNAPCLQPTT